MNRDKQIMAFVAQKNKRETHYATANKRARARLQHKPDRATATKLSRSNRMSAPALLGTWQQV
jgi:hypothetical protein